MTALNCNRLVAVIAVVICATAAFVVVDALPNGAPASSCQTLAPVHKHGGLKTARTSAAPYTLAVTKLQSGDAYDLKITGHSKAADTIKGFIVQARNKAGKVVGAFVLGPKNDKYTQHLECGSSKQGTVTHKLIDTKLSELHLQWRPSKDVTIEDVHFRATIVKGYDEFWVGLQKPLINKNASPLTL